MYKTFRVLICATILCLSQATFAQTHSNTPYSRYGLGEVNQNFGSIRNAGMANTGISAANSFQINSINPAMLPYNGYTVFDIGVNGQVKKITDGNKSQVDAGANLATLTLAVPLSQNWTSAISLRPYSSVNYQIRTVVPIAGSPQASAIEQYQGDGDISEINFGHGVRIAQGLTIGASASYLFGNITKESSSTVVDDETEFKNAEGVYYSEQTHYTGLLFKAGANYRKELNENLFLSAGAVYTLSTNLDADRNASYQRRGFGGVMLQDSILPSSMMSNVTVPSSFAAGLSLDNGKNLTIAADLTMQQWADFKNFDGENELNNSYRIAVGGEYVPDASSVGSYLKRVTYRSGIYYGVTPYEVKGEQVKDMGLTIGNTFPLGRSTIYELYQLNTAVGFGKRGSTDNGLIAENYFHFSVGVTINSRWFIKRRLE
jgi:hypothetical protein